MTTFALTTWIFNRYVHWEKTN